MKKILLLIFILQSFLLSGAFTSNLSGKCVSGEQVFVYNKTYIVTIGDSVYNNCANYSSSLFGTHAYWETTGFPNANCEQVVEPVDVDHWPCLTRYSATFEEFVPCNGDPLENIPSEGFVNVGIVSANDLTSFVTGFENAHPDAITEVKNSDTCGINAYVNAKQDCPVGEILSDDGTTYTTNGIELAHFSCMLDPNFECDSGYTKQEDNTCKPDIDCPIPPMLYEVTEAWHGFWVNDKRCVPDTSITESECNAITGAVYGKISSTNEKLSMNALLYGEGCTIESYSQNLFVNDATHDVLGFMPFSPLWKFENDLVVQAIDKLFSVGKNAIKAIRDKFANSTVTPKPNLTTHEPEIIDMEIGVDGIAYEINLNPKTPNMSAQEFKETYDYMKDNGFSFSDDIYQYNPIVDDVVPPIVNPPKYPVVSNEINDFLYQGSDAVIFNDSMLGTAKISESGSVPNLSVLESSLINRQVETTIELNSKLVGTDLKTYPTFMIKESEISLADRVESTYKGFTNYPDGSKTNFSVTRVKYNSDGRVIDSVTTSTNIPTKTSTKVFNTSYQTFKDGNGVVTNIVNNPTTITNTTSGGTTTTTNTSTNSVTTNSTQNAVDLSPVIEKLNSIDEKIQTIIDTPIPKEIAEATVRVQEFNNAVNLFDVDFNTYKDFINDLIDNIRELGTLFDDTKAILEDKPQINEIIGTCGFTVTLIQGQSPLFVDPCMFVTPYRPILALIFTLFGMFSVIGFSVKYLVSRGD